MPDRQIVPAAFAIVAALVSVNVGAALGKGLFAQVGPEGVAALRTVIAALLLLAIVRPWHTVVPREQRGWLLGYGFALGGMNLLIYWAIARIPLGVAVAIELCGPLAVVLFTSRSLRDLLWVVLAVAGLLLLVPWPGRAAPLDITGIACALGAAACWALYIVLGKRAARVHGPVAVALGMAAACLVTVPAGVYASGMAMLAPPVLALGAVVAVLSSALPYMLEMQALRRVSSRVFGAITCSAPAIAALVGVVLLGEQLTGAQWLAIALMITASAGCALATTPPLRRVTDLQGGAGV